MRQNNNGTPLSRRAFVQGGSLLLLAAGQSIVTASELTSADSEIQLRFGVITDLHFADKAPAGSRNYRESLQKLEQAKNQFERDQPKFVVELGDLIDASKSLEIEKGYLATINNLFKTLPGEKHYVLGNHCVFTLTKEEFLEGVDRKSSYYSFDQDGVHFVVLDACFREDGVAYGRNNFTWTDANIPTEQLDWLAADLKSTSLNTIVFAHQRLDETKHHSVRNAADVRKVLEKSGKVKAVFQGHSHSNSHQEIKGIHYCVVAAMVEGSGPTNSGHATVDVFKDGSLAVTGFRKQKNYQWDMAEEQQLNQR
ncbi:MAG: 3',5'-cyclic AMP phosphodiesterase CpdA [Mariniblastus sp.]|jgi:3',5'-cyclic AMP phosphodiesterase CpdA